jgi:hypothetical protein
MHPRHRQGRTYNIGVQGGGKRPPFQHPVSPPEKPPQNRGVGEGFIKGVDPHGLGGEVIWIFSAHKDFSPIPMLYIGYAKAYELIIKGST